MRRRLLLLAMSALVLLTSGAPGPLRAAELQQLAIVSKSGVRQFTVEVALTEEDQARGLMFRRDLPEGRGMLFDFIRERTLSFWMKDTYVSLDIIFIRADGRIRRIAANTTPLLERLIPSGGPVRAVLEVRAGTAGRLGIAPGDRVVHPIFRRARTAAGCDLGPVFGSGRNLLLPGEACIQWPREVPGYGAAW